MNQSFSMVAFLGAGVLIYSAVTDNKVIDVITGKATKGKGNVDTGGSSDTSTGIGNLANLAGGGAAAEAAMRAYHQQNANRQRSQYYVYDEVRPIPKSLFGAPPIRTDCSGFVTLCYKWAGLPDPNGNGYDGSGNTGTLIAHAKRAKTPMPGDLCFYGGTAGYPQHVAIFVGGGKVVSHGSPGDPSLDSVDLGIQPFFGYYRPQV